MQLMKMMFSLFVSALALLVASPVYATVIPRDDSLAEYQCSLTHDCNLAAKSWYYCAGEINDIEKWLCLCEYSEPAWIDSTTNCFACIEPLNPTFNGISNYVQTAAQNYCNTPSLTAHFSDLVAAGATGTAEHQSPISIWNSLWTEPIPDGALNAREGFAVDGMVAGGQVKYEK